MRQFWLDYINQIKNTWSHKKNKNPEGNTEIKSDLDLARLDKNN